MSSADGAAMLNAMPACVVEAEHLGVLGAITSLLRVGLFASQDKFCQDKFMAVIMANLS